MLPTMLHTVSSDFSAVSSMELTFQPVTMEQCIDITIREDTNLESSETFSVQLSTLDQNVTLAPTSATITIEDNDSKTVMFRLYHA